MSTIFLLWRRSTYVNPALKFYKYSELDIAILMKAVQHLHATLKQPAIQPFTLNSPSDEYYQVCRNCRQCIRRNHIVQIPLYSFENGCWIGDIPALLQGLSFLEEQCIAQACATRYTVKLEKGPTGQYASHGNVYIFPQEPQALADVLPPPINVFYDEIAVILVSSSNSLVTEDMLSRSLLLV